MKRILCIALYFTLLCAFDYGQKDVGDSCTIQRTNTTGTCTILDDCPRVIDEIDNYSLAPTRCGIVNNKEIVCCANLAPKVNLSPAQTRISQQSLFFLYIVLKNHLVSLSLYLTLLSSK